MKVYAKKSVLLDGFVSALPKGAIVTVVNEDEAKLVIGMGYVSETDKAPTHDKLRKDYGQVAEEEPAATVDEGSNEPPAATTAPKKNNKGR